MTANDHALCLLMGLHPACDRFGFAKLDLRLSKTASTRTQTLDELVKRASAVFRHNQQVLMRNYAEVEMRSIPTQHRLKYASALKRIKQITATRTKKAGVKVKLEGDKRLAKIAAHLQLRSWQQLIKAANMFERAGQDFGQVMQNPDIAKLLQNRILAYPAVGGGLGMLLGGLTGPSNHRGEAALRGMLRGSMAGLGASAGPVLGEQLAGVEDKRMAAGPDHTWSSRFGLSDPPSQRNELLPWQTGLGSLGGALAGDSLARASMGRPSWETEEKDNLLRRLTGG